MTVSLRDPRFHGEAPVSMTDDDRIALTVAADRERTRIVRGPWYERTWARVGLVMTLALAAANVWATLAHR